MAENRLQRAYLYQPFVPVLLGGGTLSAIRTAARIGRRHDVVCHWFGRRRLPLRGHLKYHPLPPLSSLSRRSRRSRRSSAHADAMLTQILLDFAHAEEAGGGFLSLLPCSPEAEAYLCRHRAALETAFVLLPSASPSDDPLRGLIAPVIQARNGS